LGHKIKDFVDFSLRKNKKNKRKNLDSKKIFFGFA